MVTISCHLAIIVRGGHVHSVVSNAVDRFNSVNITVIDYDHEDYDSDELIPVLQSDNSVLKAHCLLYPIEDATIDLHGVVETLLRNDDVF